MLPELAPDVPLSKVLVFLFEYALPFSLLSIFDAWKVSSLALGLHALFQLKLMFARDSNKG